LADRSSGEEIRPERALTARPPKKDPDTIKVVGDVGARHLTHTNIDLAEMPKGKKTGGNIIDTAAALLAN